MRYLLILFLLVPCITQAGELPVIYPTEVYQMSSVEFFQWATNFNQKQMSDLERRREKMTEPQYLFGFKTVNEYGWGGNHDGLFIGGDYYGSASRQMVVSPAQWLNVNYTGPGPLTLVNPYCRPVK